MKFNFFAVGWIESTHGSKNARNASHTSQLNSIHSFPHVLFRYGAKNTNRSWLGLFYLNSYSWWRKKPLQLSLQTHLFAYSCRQTWIMFNTMRNDPLASFCVSKPLVTVISIDPILLNLSPTRHLASKKEMQTKFASLMV